MGALKILMYHALGEPGEAATRFVVPVQVFERQMAWLKRARYRVLRLGAALDLLDAGEPLPRRALAITFDDGTFDVGALALPVLERQGFPATAFVVTRAMGGTVSWTEAAGLRDRRVMTWPEALRLQPLVSLAPHSRTHASLLGLDDEALAAELRGSLEDVKHQAGDPLGVFAYPFGHYDARVAGAVADAGYVAACTVRSGPNDSHTPRYELRRYEIRGDDPPCIFPANVSLQPAYRGYRRFRRLREQGAKRRREDGR